LDIGENCSEQFGTVFSRLPLHRDRIFAKLPLKNDRFSQTINTKIKVVVKKRPRSQSENSPDDKIAV
jgi:hypothetical protein